jgi:hypothetical protein
MLYVSGDSWTKPTPTVDDHYVWPTLLAKRLNLKLVNDGMGCGSNARILNCLENFYLSKSQPSYIVIALTTHLRYYMPTAEMNHWNISIGYARNEITGENDSTLSKWWVNNSYNHVESIYRYYKLLWNIHELCLKFDCPYLMFQSWDTELYKYDLLGGEEKVANFLEKYYNNENAYFRVKYASAFQTLTEQSKKWNYIEQPLEMTSKTLDSWPDGHPNKQGHELFVDFVYKQLQKV